MNKPLVSTIWPSTHPVPCEKCRAEESAVYFAVRCGCGQEHEVGEYLCLDCLMLVVEEARQEAALELLAEQVRLAVRRYRLQDKKGGDREEVQRSKYPWPTYLQN